MSKYKNGGFTLIELLIVIGIIAILASAIIVVINPGRQFASARDATRNSHINSLYNSLISYQVANRGNWGEIDLPQELTEICNSNLESPDCTGLVDLSDLVDNGYINQIPLDPHAEGYGTGYEVAEASVILRAPLAETRFIGIGIVETEYAENGNGGEFNCGDDFTDNRDGNIYATVEIGGQCWFTEDLRYECDNFNDVGEDDATNWDGDGCAPQGDNYNGLLYQWGAVMDWDGEGDPPEEGSQGICPDGWIVPTDDDFKELEIGLGMSQSDADGTGYRGDQEGDMLKSDPEVEDWCHTSMDCATSGWEGLPGGYRHNHGYIINVGSSGRWWFSTEDGTGAWARHLHSTFSAVSRLSTAQNSGHSVRCLKN